MTEELTIEKQNGVDKTRILELCKTLTYSELVQVLQIVRQIKGRRPCESDIQ